MPKVAILGRIGERIRTELVAVGLELMAKQGIQHTTVEQIYKRLVFHELSFTLSLQREKI